MIQLYIILKESLAKYIYYKIAVKCGFDETEQKLAGKL